MFTIESDKTINVTRGDIAFIEVSADANGENYKFQPGDVIKINVFAKKDCKNVVLEETVTVAAETGTVEIFLSGEKTKIGETINKPKDYWYEIVLNPTTNPQTIIGYDDEGPKIFRLYPEGEVDGFSTDSEEYGNIEYLKKNVRGKINLFGYSDITPQMFGAKGDGVTDDTQAIQKALTYLETTKSHTLFFPAGTYCVSGNGSIFRSKFVSLIGDNATIYVAEGDSNTDLFTFTGTTQNYNGKITGFEFSYANNNYTMINNVFRFVFEKDSDILYNLIISDNLFRKNKGYKIYTEGWRNGGFNNCKFNDNIVYGLFMKSLSFGDSNKIIGNSLYGSEEILLPDYVISLVQTAGSAGCEVSSNNCTSGLGYFEAFQNLYMYSNQVENTTQTMLDYIVKIYRGNGVTIENCNFNAHNHTNLVYANIINCTIRNCNFYGVKGYAINNEFAHLTIVENARYFDSDNVYYHLVGDVVNGHVTNTVYDTDEYKMWIDNSLTLHYLPKVTQSVSIAPLTCAIDTTDPVYIPVETIGEKIVNLRVTYKYALYTDTLFNVPARIPVNYY